jgi:hypothetical protein
VYEDLAALFEQIQAAAQLLGGSAHFSALPVPRLERHRLAKDAQGAPAILISVADTLGDRCLAPIVLENLSVHHDMDCRITRPSGVAEEGKFTVVRCTGGERTLQSYFLRVAATMLQSLGDSPSSLSVAQAVSRLAELFHAMKQPPRKSLQGLWAELFLIARARDPITLAGAWHTSPEELFDFSLGSQRIEVKSVRGRVRKHHFTLGQLQSPAGIRVIIASMFVEPSEAGVSLLELSEQIRHRLANRADLMLRVESVVGLTLGESWRHAIGDRFDTELAEKSLAFYDPDSIPKVNPDVPSGVSDVRFKSDLTGQQPLEVASIRGATGIFSAALRQQP